MSTPSTITSDRQVVPRNRLVRAGAAATLTALLAVVLARGLVGALYDLDLTLDPFQWGPILGTTLVAGVGATVAYGLLDRYTARPDGNFLAVAAGVFLLMLVPLATVAPGLGVTGELQWLLVALHVVVAVPLVAVLTRLGRSAGSTRTDTN